MIFIITDLYLWDVMCEGKKQRESVCEISCRHESCNLILFNTAEMLFCPLATDALDDSLSLSLSGSAEKDLSVPCLSVVSLQFVIVVDSW